MQANADAARAAQHLITEPNFHEAGKRHLWPYAAADDFYEMLIDAHRGLDDAGSAALNARLILVLANHIGDLGVLREAIAVARGEFKSQSGGDVLSRR